MGNRGKAVQTALMPFFLAHTYAQINLCINTHTINSKCAHTGEPPPPSPNTHRSPPPPHLQHTPETHKHTHVYIAMLYSQHITNKHTQKAYTHSCVRCLTILTAAYTHSCVRCLSILTAAYTHSCVRFLTILTAEASIGSRLLGWPESCGTICWFPLWPLPSLREQHTHTHTHTHHTHKFVRKGREGHKQVVIEQETVTQAGSTGEWERNVSRWLLGQIRKGTQAGRHGKGEKHAIRLLKRI